MTNICCGSDDDRNNYGLEAIVTVDERGQMVLPKDVRTRIGLKPGDKLALVTFEKDGEVCCMSLIKTDVLTAMVGQFLGPVMGRLAGAGE